MIYALVVTLNEHGRLPQRDGEDVRVLGYGSKMIN